MDLKKIIVLGTVGLVSAAAGIALPGMMGGGQGTDAAAHTAETAGHEAKDSHDKGHGGHEPKKEAPKADGHGGGDHGGHGKPDAKKKPKEGPCFLSVGSLVVNLNEPGLVKYLSIEITIQTDSKYEEEVTAALEARKPILMTWLTSHLADKNTEDIRGKVGINRLRREIQDNFNSLLFKDGHERVQDIMFEEFHVQSG